MTCRIGDPLRFEVANLKLRFPCHRHEERRIRGARQLRGTVSVVAADTWASFPKKPEFYLKSVFMNVRDGLGGGIEISVKYNAESWVQILISSIFQKLTLCGVLLAH